MTKPHRMISMLMVAFALPLACGTQTADEEDEATASAALRQTSAATDGDTTATTSTRPPIVKTPVATDSTAPAPSEPITAPASTAGVPVAAGSTATVVERAYPWDLNVNHVRGCHGTLIHPNWVLTAAHCVTYTTESSDNWRVGTVSYTRTDPTTGVVTQESREFDRQGGIRGRLFFHPGYADGGWGRVVNDVALIRLPTPFTIGPAIQTAGLPRVPAYLGRQGTVVTNRGRGGALPPGYASILRTATLASCDAGFLCLAPPAGSLCEGDSGSGFIDMVDGRAVVEGLASYTTVETGGTCLKGGGVANFTDVSAFRTWILDTIGMTAEQLAGPVRVRWSGGASIGKMSLRCVSRAIGTRGGVARTWYAVAPDVTLQDTIEVPMDVPGGEIAMGDCDQVDVAWRMQPAPAALTGYTTRTIDAGGIVTVATRRYASPLAGIGFSVQLGASFFEYTGNVKDPNDVSNSTGVEGLSAAP